MPEIILIGTYHHDPDGPEELWKILSEARPDIVILEGKEEKLRSHERYTELLRAELARAGTDIRRRQEWVEFEDSAVYESKTAKQFCDKYGIPFFYFNDSCKIQTDKERLKTARRGAKIYSRLEPEFVVNKLRINARGLYRSLRSVLDTDAEEEFVNHNIRDYYDHVGERDREMLEAYRELYKLHGDKRYVSVTGYYHILRDPESLSLFSWLMDLNPRRLVPE